MYSTIEHDNEFGPDFPPCVTGASDSGSLSCATTPRRDFPLTSFEVKAFPSAAPKTDQNAEALRLAAESGKRDRLRRQAKKERVYSVIGGGLGWILIVATVLCVIGVTEGWGALKAAVHFAEVLRAGGYH